METPVDLAALDALFQAAKRVTETSLLYAFEAEDMAEARDALKAALDAIDLPALRRRLEIGDAAVEAIDTVEALCSAWDANGFSAKCLVKDSPGWRLYQARAKLRALRETSDA